jgi:hypothetical protein
MAAERPLEQPVPPPSEEIHLPEPTYLPALVAFGVSLVVVGIVLSFLISAIGVVITLVAVILWIRDVRRDVAELPLEH